MLQWFQGCPLLHFQVWVVHIPHGGQTVLYTLRRHCHRNLTTPVDSPNINNVNDITRLFSCLRKVRKPNRSVWKKGSYWLPLTSVNLWYHIIAHSITQFGSVSGTGSTSNDASTLSSMSSECFPPSVWNDHELSLDMWLASPSQGLLDDFLCHPRHPRHPRAKCVRQNAQLAASCTQIILWHIDAQIFIDIRSNETQKVD